MGYPTQTDLKNFVKGQGLGIDPTASPYTFWDWAGAASAASSEFERAVRWFPFLASGSDSSRTFNAPVPNFTDLPRLELGGGLVSLTSVTVSGNAVVSPYVQTKPDNATAKGLPITALAFWRKPFPALPLCVSVTGNWGFCATLPDDVFQAVLRRAAQLLMAESLLSVSGVTSKWKEGDVEQQTGTDSVKLAVQSYEQAFERVVVRYRRP